MSIKDKKAHDVMTRARTLLAVSQPFFGCLSLHLQLVEVSDKERVCQIWGSEEAGTMAVDGKNLFYYPPFALKLADAEVQGVCAHEVMHCALKHMTRRGHRDAMLWNIAADFVINLDLKKAGFSLPGQPIGLDMMLKPPKKGTQPPQGHLYDEQFEGMGTDEVYERINRHTKKVKIYVDGCGAGQDPGGCGRVIDAKDGTGSDKEGADQGKGLSAADLATLDSDWDTNVRMAAAIAKKANAGNVPGYLARLVEELDKPRIDWKQELRDFVDNSCEKTFSWMRPNRRSAATGVLTPGYISDSLRKLLFIVDISGSIDGHQMKSMGSEAAGALYDGVCDAMNVIYTDTEMKKDDEFLRGDIVKIESPGGGGTDFKAVMEYVAEHHSDANAIVFLTDTFTGSWGEDPGIPVLWGSITPLREAHQPPYGRLMYVDIERGE